MGARIIASLQASLFWALQLIIQSRQWISSSMPKQHLLLWGVPPGSPEDGRAAAFGTDSQTHVFQSQVKGLSYLNAIRQYHHQQQFTTQEKGSGEGRAKGGQGGGNVGLREGKGGLKGGRGGLSCTCVAVCSSSESWRCAA